MSLLPLISAISFVLKLEMFNICSCRPTGMCFLTSFSTTVYDEYTYWSALTIKIQTWSITYWAWAWSTYQSNLNNLFIDFVSLFFRGCFLNSSYRIYGKSHVRVRITGSPVGGLGLNHWTWT